MVVPLHPRVKASRYTSATSSRVAELGKFTVLLTALSVYSWKAACIFTCQMGETSWAQTNTRLISSGMPSTWAREPCSTICFIRASE